MERFEDGWYREPFNKCPGDICDGSGWIHSGWESVVCPACEKYLLTGKYEKNKFEMWVDGDHLEEFNKLLERLINGEFDQQIKEFGDKIRAEREGNKRS